jgi:tetratricopeptide (TPR) repeat protein
MRQGIDSLQGFHLVRAAQLAQRNWENQYNLAVYFISKGQNGQAEQLLTKTTELNPAFAPAKFEHAKLLLHKGDLENAFRKFDEALLLDPKDARYQSYYAYAANITGRHTIANSTIAAALKNTPQNSTVLYIAGLIHFNNGNNNAAERSLREALRYSPTDMLALESLGDVLAADFKYGEAVANYLKVWQAAGYSERIAHKLGKTLAYSGKFIEAKDFLEVAAKNTKNGEVMYRLVDVYCELGNINLANSLLSRFGSSNLVWHKAAEGRIHEASNEIDLAQTAYTAVVALDGQNAMANAGLGRLSLKEGNFNSAITYFDIATAQEPANMQNLISKAKVYDKKGSIEEAVATYEAIVARDSKHPEIYLAIAAIKEEKNNARGAIKTLTDGLAANPKDNSMLLALGKLYQLTRQYDLAISTYQTTIGKKPTAANLQSLRIIGDIYYKNLSNEKKAKEYFKKYVRAGGKDSDVQNIIKKNNNKERTQIALN